MYEANIIFTYILCEAIVLAKHLIRFVGRITHVSLGLMLILIISLVLLGRLQFSE